MSFGDAPMKKEGAVVSLDEADVTPNDTPALDAYTDLMAELLDGEEVISLVFGDFGWAGYHEPEPPSVPRDKRGVLLTLEEARPYMRGWTFFCDYGAPMAYATYIWTNRRVLWVTQYDGSTDLDWAPSLPAAMMPRMPGG